ncbi:alpha-glucosidase/alpha-galactosidase [Anaerocolumna cellulosilytica]|uniref:Alpha-glucosidase/alpha-galactosidase n=1 Tax=Anaerocolumna cellulosilytica TaxID=433286 RepID=A0A6S6R4E6_9FIRM|nr:alpha-glucosidase/alpha-galactosidase [Anaerocolumna cellulosilytica]MBB5194686.1 alpha-galactosidase [Anaerocolumna cellulosilytica]BCJ94352.1 alpha-glucosidase/alpha-galactosidase [Anaerocolumna cellulosilytica]
MIYKDNKVSDLKIAYIGGGSRGWAWTFMTDLSMEPALSGTIRLYDIDNEAAKNNEIIGNSLTNRSDTVGKWDYTTVSNLKEALTDIDFVIISILPGTFDEMASDVHLPERLGIYQSVGDTAGPGGLVRGLRTIPMFVEIAEAVKDYAPNAWVINYTNPMSVCVKTLYHVFPAIKAFGCCHEVFGTQKVLKGILESSLKLSEVNRSDIHVNVLGINHFTWFDSASYKGIDLFPIYKDYIAKNYEEGYHEADKNWANSTFSCAHRVKFDLFNRYGLIAAAGDRHLAEFMPGDEYLKNPETVTSWKFGLTTVDWRKKDLEERLAKSKRLAAGEETVELKPSGEEGILLIKALCGLERVISNVNIPNTDKQISNLPESAIVETNAVFERDRVRPIQAGEIPENILSLVKPHVDNHELILEAAISINKEKALEAFLNDPLIKNQCTKEEASKLLDDMIKNTLTYLPSEWAEQV